MSDPGSPAKDTLFVAFNGYSIGHDPKEKRILSDSLVLKYYRGYYFLNINTNTNPEWLLRVIKRERNGDLVYMNLEGENSDFSVFIKKLSSEVKVDSVEIRDGKLYRIDPTPQQLISLIDKGYFKKITLKKIN